MNTKACTGARNQQARKLPVGLGMVLLAVLAFSSVALAQEPAQTPAQTPGQPPARARRDAQEKKSDLPFDVHNLSAVWLLRTPYAGISNHPPPFTPAGKALYDLNKPAYGPKAVPPALGNDVIGNCDPTGFPRNMFSPSRAVEFIQLPAKLVQIFQYRSAWRMIWSDGRALPKIEDVDPTWYGYSVGKWDGDTFVVNTTGLRPETWLDHFGYPHSEDMTVEERYHRTDHDTFELVLTVNDPKTYTQPWVSDNKIFKLNPMQQIEEEYCVPSEEQKYNSIMRDPAAGKTGK
jgi:hypothetical protein